MTLSSAYHPLNVLKPVAENVWVVDARPPITHFEMPIRMTVVRLSGGDLLLHSPTPFNRALHDDLKELGRVRYLVAPNVAHWIYVKEWQEVIPETRTFSVPALGSRAQVREAGLSIDEELTPESKPFGRDIEIELITAPLFQEAALFHRPSRTLILADTVQNLEPESLPLGIRLFGSALGILAPYGRAPIYLRTLIRLNKAEAVQAMQRLVDLGPERVIFAHGEWFDKDATSQLRRSFRWLLASPEDERPRSTVSPWVPTGLAAGVLLIGFFVWHRRRRRSQIEGVAEDLLALVRSKKWGR